MHLAPVAALDVGSDHLSLGWAGCMGLGPGSWKGAPGLCFLKEYGPISSSKAGGVKWLLIDHD